MAPTTKPQHHLDLGNLQQASSGQTKSGSSTANSSPIEQPSGNNNASRLSGNDAGNAANYSHTAAGVRRNTGSPSNEPGSRLFPRRARELQSEATGRSMWGPPTASGLSTPLRETIPESPGDDTFPDLGASGNDSNLPTRNSSTRRSRAGTVPTQFSPAVGSLGNTPTQQASSSKSSTRPTPSTSPFRPGSSNITGVIGRSNSSASASGRASLLSRFRAGSMPQRPGLLPTSSSNSPFGSSVFSSSWHAMRDRASTHSGAHSTDPNSPSTGFQKDFSDMDEKTLRYLDLETDYEPQYPNGPNVQQLLANQSSLNKANRFRSFSTSAKEKKAAEEYGYDVPELYGYSAAEALAFQQAQINEQIAQHNMAVQQFSSQTSVNRPRARTAGTLDNLGARSWRNVGTSHFADDPLTRSVQDYGGLSDTFRALSLQNQFASDFPQDLEADTSSEATRALWLGGIPSSTTQSSLKVAFEPYGPIESARVLTQKGCGFVNFERKESAIHAKNHLQGKEIFPGAPVRIGYAKAPSASGTPANEGMYQSPSPDPYAQSHGKGTKSSTTTSGLTGHRPGAGEGATVSIPELSEIKDDILQIVKELGATEEDHVKIAASVDEALHHEYYEPEIPPVQEPSQNRMFDAPRLRDIRKRIDNNSCSAAEIEEIAMTMLPEIAELSSDYLGNTVVQKLFEFCSEHVKEAMLQEIAPHLAEIGVHKNGTWAAQKIIDVARTPAQMKLIADQLRAYSMALFLDQYGNYVMQCCLRFQVPWNNFIFEAMLSRLWPVAQGRFGARAMRACLESHYSTKDQQRMLAAAVALHSVHLATNANGALLLTWFLDTCNFPNRRKVLAPRLEPHLVHLCTHKVAYLTVLKVINQRNEPEARDSLLSALFFTPDDYVLEQVLKDQSCGAMFVFKVLTTPFLEDDFRSSIVENVRNVLLKIKAQPSQGYKRLMDEVGLSTRGSHAPPKENSGVVRDTTDASAGAAAPSSFERQLSGVMGNEQGQPQFNAGVPMPSQRSSSVDSNMSFDQFSGSGMRGGGPPGMLPTADMSPQAQLQYQQGVPAGRPTGGYSANPHATNGFSGAPPPGITNASRPGVASQQPVAMAPGMLPQGGFNPQGNFGQVNGMNNGSMKMWQQYPNGYVMPQQQMHGQAMADGGSRGRR